MVSSFLFLREDIKQKYEDKLQKEMTGPTFEVISRVMKAIVQRKITVPGSFKGYVVLLVFNNYYSIKI